MTSHPALRLVSLTFITALLAAMAAPAGAQNIADEAVRPIVHGGELTQIKGIKRETFGLINQRLAFLRPARGGREAGGGGDDAQSRELETWWQFFGLNGNQSVRDQVSGYDAETFGLAAGMDKAVSDRTVLGASFAWGNSAIDAKGDGNAKSELDSYLLGLYGDYDTGRFYANAALTYGYNKIATTKSWTGAKRSGNYRSHLYSARVELGYALLRTKTRLIPKLIGEYSHYAPGAYTEEGAAAQHIAYDAADGLEIGAGLDLNWLLANGEGSYWVPAMSLGYRYDMLADATVAESQFVAGGPVTRIEGVTQAPGAFDLGLGLAYHSAADWELLFRYGFTARQDYTGHAGMVRAAYKFE